MRRAAAAGVRDGHAGLRGGDGQPRRAAAAPTTCCPSSARWRRRSDRRCCQSCTNRSLNNSGTPPSGKRELAALQPASQTKLEKRLSAQCTKSADTVARQLAFSLGAPSPWSRALEAAVELPPQRSQRASLRSRHLPLRNLPPRGDSTYFAVESPLAATEPEPEA